MSSIFRFPELGIADLGQSNHYPANYPRQSWWPGGNIKKQNDQDLTLAKDRLR